MNGNAGYTGIGSNATGGAATASGGAGYVVISYPGPTQRSIGGTVSIVNGLIYHVFNTAGSFTFTT